MKLTESQQKKVMSKFDKLWENKECTICSNNSWNLSDVLFESREFQGGDMVIGGDSVMMVYIPATCDNCGNTHFFNSKVLGIDIE